jgi:hypothetical protein
MSSDVIKKLASVANLELKWSNLVVLNGGSIINSGVKDWTVNEKIDAEKMVTITQIDEELFNSVIAALKDTTRDLPNYTYSGFTVQSDSDVKNENIGKVVIQFDNMDGFARAMVNANNRLRDEVFGKNDEVSEKPLGATGKPLGTSFGGSRKKKKRVQKYTRR